MSKKLEEAFNLPPTFQTVEIPEEFESNTSTHVTLRENLEEFDRISASLPTVEGLGFESDREFDDLAKKSIQSYEDLMDLGFNVEARFGPPIFEVAAKMLKNAVDAKAAKIDKKLQVVQLQLKKMQLDQRKAEPLKDDTIPVKGSLVVDRNELIQKLRQKSSG